MVRTSGCSFGLTSDSSLSCAFADLGARSPIEKASGVPRENSRPCFACVRTGRPLPRRGRRHVGTCAHMSSSFGIASVTRAANLDVTGPSGGPGPPERPARQLPLVCDHVLRTTSGPLVASIVPRNLLGARSRNRCGMAGDGGRARGRRWIRGRQPPRREFSGTPGIRGWPLRWKTSPARARRA